MATLELPGDGVGTGAGPWAANRSLSSRISASFGATYRDPVLGHLASDFATRIPGAVGQPHQEFRPGGHFVQDDRGEDIAAALIAWWSAVDQPT